MREIAYQGWDKRRRFLFIAKGLRFRYGELVRVRAPIRPDSDKYAWFPAEGYELLEYTGPVDGHNTMLFWGSVAELAGEGYWRVVYDAGQYVLESPDGTNRRSLALYADDLGLRAIGNVYEDDDLLEPKTS